MENGSVESVSLGDYVGVVWRRKWIVLIVTLLVGGAAAIYAKHEQTLYSSTSTVVFNPGANATSTSATSKSGQAGNWGAQYLDLADSQDFYQLTITRHVTRRCTRRQPPSDLQNQTKVAATSDGNGLQFTVSDPSAARAQTIAQCARAMVPG